MGTPRHKSDRRQKTTSAHALTLLLLLLLTCLTTTTGCSLLGGAFKGPPEDMNAHISDGAKQLLVDAVADIDPALFTDHHVHMVSPDVHPHWRSWLHPFQCLRTEIFLSAAAVNDDEQIAENYARRLISLLKNFPIHCRVFLYAFDKYYRPDGTHDPDKTNYHVSNDSVVNLARRYPDLFIPVISIHPYRADAVDELRRWAAQGCRFVKWLPNSQGMDPSSPRTEPFYQALRELNMVLLVHTGAEDALDAEGSQHLGNPLLLRKPLDAGVTIIALHAGGYGAAADLDHPDQPPIPSSKLFFRLMDDPKYKDLLFGDISASTFYMNVEPLLLELLKRTDLHHRLLNGSDYPVAAINVATFTSKLVDHNLITEQQRRHLNEIYAYNPLLFDFAVKRTLRHPQTGARFAPSVFQTPPQLKAPPISPAE